MGWDRSRANFFRAVTFHRERGGGTQRPGRHSSWTNSLGLHALQEIIPGFIYRTAHGGGMLIGQLTEVGCLTAGLAEDSRL